MKAMRGRIMKSPPGLALMCLSMVMIDNKEGTGLQSQQYGYVRSSWQMEIQNSEVFQIIILGAFSKIFIDLNTFWEAYFSSISDVPSSCTCWCSSLGNRTKIDTSIITKNLSFNVANCRRPYTLYVFTSGSCTNCEPENQILFRGSPPLYNASSSVLKKSKARTKQYTYHIPDRTHFQN